MPRSRIDTESVTATELLQVDLWDRSFLSEQGQVVTRGFVRLLDVEPDRWTLHLRDIEHLDKNTGTWRPDQAEDRYGGTLDHSDFRRLRGGRSPVFDVGIELSGYGLFIHVGVRAEAPWSENDWPELDTDFLSPGPMH